MQKPSEIYEKMISGDPLSDSEVNEGVEFFTKLADDLYKCGPAFRLTANEANRVSYTMRQFQRAREIERPRG